MAERPSVKDILAAARKGGPARPADEAAAPISQSEREAGAPEASVPDEPMELSSAPEPEPAPEPAAPAPPPPPLGRPLTLAEKLAAARAGGAARPASAAPAKAAPKPAAPAEPAA